MPLSQCHNTIAPVHILIMTLIIVQSMIAMWAHMHTCMRTRMHARTQVTHTHTYLLVAVGVAEVMDDLRTNARLLPSPLMLETFWYSGGLAFTAGSWRTLARIPVCMCKITLLYHSEIMEVWQRSSNSPTQTYNAINRNSMIVYVVGMLNIASKKWSF